MAHPMGESKPGCLRVDFDRRLKLEFHGSQITSDGGLLAYRELDDALGLTEMAEGVFHDSRTGKNGWHGITGQFRQSVFGRLGGYDDVNDADRLGRDPAMRWVVGGKAIERQAASTSQMGRFETECPSSKQMGLLSVFHKGGSGSSLFDVKPLGFDGSSGGFGWSVFDLFLFSMMAVWCPK